MKPPISDMSCELLGDFFATFAHATRMRIFCALQSDAKTVTEIAEHAGISVPNASQHLRLMRDRRAVVAEKQAQSVYYRIADPRLVEAVKLIRTTLLEGLQRNTERAGAGPPPARRREKVFETA
jgi:DNA-binding transcriptional ArsR family regulator